MSLQCYLCKYKAFSIKDTCYHLRNVHMLFDSSNLILKCCTGCPAVFGTYCGFIKHMKKCILKKQIIISSNVYENENLQNFQPHIENFEDFHSENDNNHSTNNTDVASNELFTEKRQQIEKTVSNYVTFLFLRFA